MAQAQHGGYRKPANPAPVSGPGAMSKRTDGQPARYVSGMDYGDGQELMTQQQAAPMSGGAPTGGGPMDALLAKTTTPISAPTQYPERPLTNGQPFGPGAGPEVLATAGATGPTRAKLMATLPALMRAAERPDASPELRSMVSYLRSLL